MRSTTWKREDRHSRNKVMVFNPDGIYVNEFDYAIEVFVDEVGALCVFHDNGRRTTIYAPGTWEKVEIALVEAAE